MPVPPPYTVLRWTLESDKAITADVIVPNENYPGGDSVVELRDTNSGESICIYKHSIPELIEVLQEVEHA